MKVITGDGKRVLISEAVISFFNQLIQRTNKRLSFADSWGANQSEGNEKVA